MTVEKLIERLRDLPGHAACYAYEGEGHGIVVLGSTGHELAFIEMSETDPDVERARAEHLRRLRLDAERRRARLAARERNRAQ